MGEITYKKNEEYSQEKIIRIMELYRFAKEFGDERLKEEQLKQIYAFIHKYVYRVLWDNYRSMMSNPQYRDDLVQDVWLKIFQEIDNYDYRKASLTTFIAPWIRHVASEFSSRHFKNTTVYYSAAMNKITSAVNYCHQHGLDASFDNIVKITQLPEVTVEQSLELIQKKHSVSYEYLADNGYEQTTHVKGPEECVLMNERVESFNEFAEQCLSSDEIRVLTLLMNPKDPRKETASFREISERMNTNIPIIKRTVSRALGKIKNNKKLVKMYSNIIRSPEDAMLNEPIPVLGDDDFIDEQMQDLKEFADY